MNRFLLILIIGVLSVLGVQARETVKGMVLDAHGDPLPGVKVEVPGTSQFVFTDFDGAFQIILRDPVKKLDFSYPGLGTTSHRVMPEMTVVLGKGWAGREKGYRGMIDLEGGMGIKGNVTIKSGANEVRDIHTLVLTGFTQTHGYQFNKHLYVGLGFGAYLELLSMQEGSTYNNSEESYYESWTSLPVSAIHIPLFISARWDFGLSQKTAPYVGVRLGYGGSIGFGDEIAYASSSNFNSWTSIEVSQGTCSYLYFAPYIGYRMTIHNKFGMNLGLSYMIGRKNKYNATLYQTSYDSQGQGYSNYTDFEFTQRTSDVLMFNIGFDF